MKSSNDTSANGTIIRKKACTPSEAIVKAGGFGRYQCLLLLAMILANNAPGLVVYGVAYYELEPPYICHYNAPPAPPSPDNNAMSMAS